MSKPTYTAVFERDREGWWFVTVAELPGCHSQGRTLSRARNRLREAIALWLDVDEDAFDLEEDVRLSRDALAAARQARDARQRATTAREEANASARAAAQALAQGGGLSVRDVAELLGLSHQRVSQLLSGPRQTRAQ